MVRPVVVWLGATSAALGAAALAPGAWHATRTGAGDDVIDLVVAVCATGLALAAAWLWVITTATVAALLLDRRRPGVTSVAGGTVRRWVLVACGAAVVAGTSTPALAAGDRAGSDGREGLVGLSLPERAVAPERHGPRPAHATIRPASVRVDAHVVRPGESLWAIAAAHPVGETSIDQRWRTIWQANRDVVGDDPDLILPGQALHLPGDTHDSNDHHDTDGAR
ncbi:LysM peptidoglycan-binding domain-containing protein [Nocardioides hwasunensis]|uniref:LysM peptidoglycan-binding domain-containing protein n=1 Tax=Nocardioides hwasunensis TaxID=397258 RepID=A0ABR8MDX4_9ACTN|nr:LysM peptidoglycan-binding domain-containing protein [Nocardioides hwasunensis]MBD3914319.1 LysM peptidoglycan-binding domain-containing protein [Nocardioides hwasunensis]